MIDLGIAASAFIQEYNKHYRNRQIPTGAAPMTIDLDAAIKTLEAHTPNDVICKKADLLSLIQRLREAEKDAEIGKVVWRFIDRMNDVSPPEDSAERILGEFVAAVMPLLLLTIDQQRKIATGEDLGRPVNADTPRDYMQPEWHVHNRVHGWRNYISDELQTLWPTFTSEQRAALARNAEELAGREHWD